MNLKNLPKALPSSDDCVRWNPETQKFEIVKDGLVFYAASRMKLAIRAEEQKFRRMARAALAAQHG